VRPGLPDGWDRFRLKRAFRGAVYDITVRRAANGERGGWRVDGVRWHGEFLPLAEAGTIQQVEIVI